MSVLLRIPAPLRECTGGSAEVEVAPGTVGDALGEVTARYPLLRRHLYEDDGRLRRHVNLYVNRDDVRSLHGESTPIRAGDTVLIVPSIAGGSAPGTGPEGRPAPLGAAELRRYARHLVLPEVGPAGQRTLKAARVAVAGMGGLGCPVSLYLAAAGVGVLGLIDHDEVDESNLQRQVLYGSADTGRRKVEAAAERLQALNPHVELVPHDLRLTRDNALDVLAGYDIVVDGADNFPTRYLINDACGLLGKPYVYGALLRFEGQVAVFDARRGPCYRCLFREPPPPGLVPSCAEGGVLGVLPGIVGSLQALEAIKLVLGAGDTLLGRLVIFDGLSHRWRELQLRKDPECPLCGSAPTITAPIDYDAFCGGPAADTPPAAAQAADAAAGVTPEMSVRELSERLQRGERPKLLDVREPYEWEIANLGEHGARLLPLSELPGRLDEVGAPEEEIVVYCRTGSRSAYVVDALRAAGFRRAVNLAGGLHAWAREIEPGMPRY
jgi:sulfur-carrier protein adenylyltransferase/sulfurtransferase